MQYNIPIEPIPNQFFSTSLDGVTWEILLETRLDNIYISLTNNDGLVLSNRICRDKTHIGHGFVFYDIDGNSDPYYEMLGTRFLLIWTDEY